MEEEYELVPMGPIRKLEKRVNRIERSSTSGEMLAELMEIIKTNQKVVDSMSKSNTAMIERIHELNGSVSKLLTRVDDFISRIETAESQPVEEKNLKEGELNDRIAKLEKRLNSILLTAAAKQRTNPRSQLPVF